MKRLVKSGPITTIMGLGIIGFTGAMIWTGKATAGELGGWLALGIMLLRSKDSLIGLGKEEE